MVWSTPHSAMNLSDMKGKCVVLGSVEQSLLPDTKNIPMIFTDFTEQRQGHYS